MVTAIIPKTAMRLLLATVIVLLIAMSACSEGPSEIERGAAVVVAGYERCVSDAHTLHSGKPMAFVVGAFVIERDRCLRDAEAELADLCGPLFVSDCFAEARAAFNRLVDPRRVR